MEPTIFGANPDLRKPGVYLATETLDGLWRVVIKEYYWCYNRKPRFVYKYLWKGSLLDQNITTDYRLLGYQSEYAKKRFKPSYVELASHVFL